MPDTTVDRPSDETVSAETGDPGSIYHRLFLTPTWYLEVDDRGYLAGEFAEGAFGCVLMVRSVSTTEGQFALKIPRLLKDTIRENAFIVTVAEDEVKNNLEIAGKGQKPGLLQCNGMANLLRGPLSLAQHLSKT